VGVRGGELGREKSESQRGKRLKVKVEGARRYIARGKL